MTAAGVRAQAAPDAPAGAAQSDPVLQLLQDRGVLPPTASTDPRALARQVRDAASDLVISAMNFLGVPYRRGGNSPDEGFDCSGFTRHVFEHSLGLLLPRRADEQAREPGLLQIGRNELRPGDLVFFIYVGDDKFIHSPRTGAAVRMESMREAYWSKRFNGARRAGEAAIDTAPGAVAVGSPQP
jgi:cell wall-associated NlpC family hydrolase